MHGTLEILGHSFRLEDDVKHYSCGIYWGNCACGGNYFGESAGNVFVRWVEKEDPNKQSESVKYFFLLNTDLNENYWLGHLVTQREKIWSV